MLDFYGCCEFTTDFHQLSGKHHSEDEINIISSWCNAVILSSNGHLQTTGFIHQQYQDKINSSHGPITKDAVFVGQDLVLLKPNGLSVITDKLEHLRVILSTANSCPVNRLFSTENSVLLLLESNECLMCKGVSEEIERLSFGATTTLTLNPFHVCSDVQEISCGKEHVVILNTSGSVFTFGNGSRGQLGHGAIDSQEKPKMVENLAGLKMVSVAAGGWHSVSISECGDIYCWGWNESGQLGLPSPSMNTNGTHQAETKGVSRGTITSPGMASTHSPEKTGVVCGTGRADLLYSETMIFIQDITPVQIQSQPIIIDLLDQFSIKKVCCGSRHTVLLSDTGVLLSSGWNDYRQLCQGDRLTRDYFETVSKYCKDNLTIMNVFCGPWSTIVHCSDSDSD